MYLDENDDEGWRSWHAQPFPNLEKALLSVAKDGSWIFFYPIMVHPDYQTAVWELVHATAGKLTEEFPEVWERRSQNWKHICQPEP